MGRRGEGGIWDGGYVEWWLRTVWRTSTRARAFAMAACWRTCCMTSVFASILKEVCGGFVFSDGY